jgi:hypothetical protein
MTPAEAVRAVELALAAIGLLTVLSRLFDR